MLILSILLTTLLSIICDSQLVDVSLRQVGSSRRLGLFGDRSLWIDGPFPGPGRQANNPIRRFPYMSALESVKHHSQASFVEGGFNDAGLDDSVGQPGFVYNSPLESIYASRLQIRRAR